MAPVSKCAIPTYAVIPVRDRHYYTIRLVTQLDLPPQQVIIVDNESDVPAHNALAGLARVVEFAPRNISLFWNIGLELAAADAAGPHNVALLNNDLDVSAGFLDRLAVALRARPDHVIVYPDYEARLPPGVCDSTGHMSGYAFMLRGEDGLRADPRFEWWYGDDLAQQARVRGKVVCVGGVYLTHLEPDAATRANPQLREVADEDHARFHAKWSQIDP